MNVIDQVVRHNLCCGCGICAGCCPNGHLRMAWNQSGQLEPHPVETISCIAECTLCISVCPFHYSGKDTDCLAKERFGDLPAIQKSKHVGYYDTGYAGFSSEFRPSSTSGGMVSWLLRELLRTGQVAALVVVGAVSPAAEDRLFMYKIITSEDEISACAGSKYYPVEISSSLHHILADSTPARYAVTCLPCVARGLRLAMQLIPSLATKISYIITLTCGQLPNKQYTELMAEISGVSHSKLEKVAYRIKDTTGSSMNYAFKAVSNNGAAGKLVHNVPLSLYLNHYQLFVQNACRYCDDLFGELGDVSCMDAWLPEYIDNPNGTSLLLVRNPVIKNILMQGEQKRECVLEEIGYSQIAASQQGGLERKSDILAARLYRDALRGELKQGSWRVSADKKAYKRWQRYLKITDHAKKTAQGAWQTAKEQDKPAEAFILEIRSTKIRIKLYELGNRLLRIMGQPL